MRIEQVLHRLRIGPIVTDRALAERIDGDDGRDEQHPDQNRSPTAVGEPAGPEVSASWRLKHGWLVQRSFAESESQAASDDRRRGKISQDPLRYSLVFRAASGPRGTLPGGGSQRYHGGSAVIGSRNGGRSSVGSSATFLRLPSAPGLRAAASAWPLCSSSFWQPRPQSIRSARRPMTMTGPSAKRSSTCSRRASIDSMIGWVPTCRFRPCGGPCSACPADIRLPRCGCRRSCWR